MSLSRCGVFVDGAFRSCGEATQTGGRYPQCIGRAVRGPDNCTCPTWKPAVMEAAAHHKLTASNADEMGEALMGIGWSYREAMRTVYPRDPFWRD